MRFSGEQAGALDALIADIAGVVFITTRELIALVAVGIAVSSLDDLVVDLGFLLGRIRKRRDVRPNSETMVTRTGDAGWMAILVPAWDEADVIEDMLRNLVSRLDYTRYVVFVGTYSNDPATRAAAERVADHRIIGITVPRPGPTSKADCLNTLWRGARAYEDVIGMQFKAVVLHDAEDLVDPEELRVFDALIPSAAMVQLPVVPLIDDSSRWIAGHYADEFAEAHGKDIVFRDAIGAAVPSAGVGCAIDRDFLMGLSEQSGGLPFDPACQVEDYELGIRLAAAGAAGRFVRVPSKAGGVIATREHFPATFSAARRQKARWVMGIALHGWDRLGWPGDWRNRLMLARDRKSIVTALVTALAYASLFLIALLSALRAISPQADRFPPLIGDDTWLEPLLMLNLGLLIWRLGMRAYFTGRTYGWREGIRSVPRAVIGNVVNILAAGTAVRRYWALARGTEALRWDKTRHRFPTGAGGI